MEKKNKMLSRVKSLELFNWHPRPPSFITVEKVYVYCVLVRSNDSFMSHLAAHPSFLSHFLDMHAPFALIHISSFSLQYSLLVCGNLYG